MGEIGSRPYPEPWGEAQRLVADPVWPGADERALADLAGTLRASAGANQSMCEELRSHAARLEDHATGSMAVAPEAARELAKQFESFAELDEQAARLLDASAVEVRELKVELSVIGAQAQADQARRWEPLLRATGGASWAERLARQSLEADMARARERAAVSEAAQGALRRHHADLVGEGREQEAGDPLDDGPVLRAEPRSPTASTTAMSASAPAPEHHGQARPDEDGQADDSASTSAMAAAPLAPPPTGFGSPGAYTPTSYGPSGSFHDAAGLSHAGASGLLEEEDPEQGRIDYARAAYARMTQSRDHSPYRGVGSPVDDVLPPVWLALAAYYDADWQTRLHLLTGEGLGWIPPGVRVPERVEAGEVVREIRERPAQSVAASFPAVVAESGGRAALVCVVSGLVPMDGDADLVRRLNDGNEDGWRREAVLTGPAPDGGTEAGGFLCHRLWHADQAMAVAAQECDVAALPAACVRLAEICVETSLAADDPALLEVVGSWREGRSAQMGRVRDLVRTSAGELHQIRGLLAQAGEEERRVIARSVAPLASAFSAGAAMLLADGAPRTRSADLHWELFLDVCYEYAQCGGDEHGVRRAIALAGGSHQGV